MRRSRTALALSTGALAIALAVLAACGGEGEAGSRENTGRTAFSGYVRTPALEVDGVTLPALDGTPQEMTARRGGLRLVYFGYTSCPDVCPTTMATVREALRTLPEVDRGRVDVVMVTIDPARDTAERLTTYLATFVADGKALRTDDQELLRKVTNAFGADYRITPVPDGDPEVSHTGDVYAVDDAGTVVIAWPFGIAAKPLRADLVRLLDGELPPTNPT